MKLQGIETILYEGEGVVLDRKAFVLLYFYSKVFIVNMPCCFQV